MNSEMPAGRELDGLLAEMMGWYKLDFGDGLFEYWCKKRTQEDFPDATEEWLEQYPDVTTGYSVASVPEDLDIGIGLGLICHGAWNPSSNLALAWYVLEHVTSPPTTVEDAKRAANTRIALWFDKASLWAMTSEEAALALCQAMLEAVQA